MKKWNAMAQFWEVSFPPYFSRAEKSLSSAGEISWNRSLEVRQWFLWLRGREGLWNVQKKGGSQISKSVFFMFIFLGSILGSSYFWTGWNKNHQGPTKMMDVKEPSCVKVKTIKGEQWIVPLKWLIQHILFISHVLHVIYCIILHVTFHTFYIYIYYIWILCTNCIMF